MNVVTRWWLVALGATGFLAGRAWTGPDPDRHWSARNGDDWRALGPTEQTAYTEGFLAGAALGQAGEHAADSAGLTQEIARMRHDGRFRLPFGANVYLSRINDYYWWENHRPFPLWYAFWEVNSSLTGPMNDSAR
ncbi:MAG: hypothetical protein ACREL3_10545 [Gemmatimonadales bacterium]